MLCSAEGFSYLKDFLHWYLHPLRDLYGRQLSRTAVSTTTLLWSETVNVIKTLPCFQEFMAKEISAVSFGGPVWRGQLPSDLDSYSPTGPGWHRLAVRLRPSVYENEEIGPRTNTAAISSEEHGKALMRAHNAAVDSGIWDAVCREVGLQPTPQ